MKARSVPYALKAKVEQELERLQGEGIISPVEFSEWAAPIVPVVKSNVSVCILCGDYKCIGKGIRHHNWIIIQFPRQRTLILATLDNNNTNNMYLFI